MKRKDGITIIALIVTIVVLLILAGVSISLMLGNNGVISRAKDAKNQYTEAQINDEKNLNEAIDWIDSTVSGEYDGVPIPNGFVYVGGTKESGLVISDNIADKEKYKGKKEVGIDLQGNQFVWIPVENITDYKREAYTIQIATGTIDEATNSEIINYNSAESGYFTETLPEDEKLSVEANKGFFIGRYEAGDRESTEAKKFREDGDSIKNAVTVKAGQIPYNLISKSDAQNLAEEFSKKQNYNDVKSKLLSSYAWDTAIDFIQKTNSDYSINSIEGNYSDTTFSYVDITTGKNNEKAKNSNVLVPTGQTTSVNNIYDMGGNVWEWTTETCSYSARSCTERGGSYSIGYSVNPSGYRYHFSDVAYNRIGFRITLFLT